MNEAQITKNIKALRKIKNLTLQDLANRAGLTKGYLSKIERSKKAPPYSTLEKIAGAMDIDVSSFINGNVEETRDPRITFVKRDNGKIVETSGSFYGYKYETLAFGKVGKNMEPYIIEAAFDEKGLFQHEGEEFLYVLEGTHEFVYDGKSYIMEQGDSVYFDSGVPHNGRSLGETKAKLLAVMYSYKRL